MSKHENMITFLRPIVQNEIATKNYATLQDTYETATWVEDMGLFPKYDSQKSRDGSIRQDVFLRAEKAGYLQRIARGRYGAGPFFHLWCPDESDDAVLAEFYRLREQHETGVTTMPRSRTVQEMLRTTSGGQALKSSYDTILDGAIMHVDSEGTISPSLSKLAELKRREFPVVEDAEKPVYVKLADLNYDMRYQYDPETEPGRKASLLRFLHEAGGYNPNEHGPFFVNRRPDGSLWNMDGGGGAWMATRCGLTRHLAIISEYPTWEEEAAFFARKNRNARRITNAHIFVTDANAGIEPNATILRHVREAKYQIEREKGNKGRRIALPSLLFVFHLDGTGCILQKALLDMRNSVADATDVDGRLAVAIGVIHAAFRVDQELLRACLLHDPTSKDDPVAADKAVRLLLQKSRLDASVTISGLPQPRNSNPYVVRELLRRMNFKRHSKNRFEYDSVYRLESRFEGKSYEYQDVWNWK